MSILLAPGSKIANLAREEFKKLNHRNKMADLNKIIDELSTLTVVEAAELSKQLEEKWELQQQPQLQLHQPVDSSTSRRGKSEFSIFLASAGDKKLMQLRKLEQ